MPPIYMKKPWISTPETGKFELIYNLRGQTCENVFYVTHPGGFSESTLLTKCADLKNWFSTDMRVGLSGQLELIRILGTDMSSQTGPKVEYPVEPLINGATAGGAAPANVAFCIKVLTAQRGRSYRGRFYIAGIPTENISGDTLLTNIRALYLDHMNALLTAVSGGGGDHMVVVSYMHNSLWRATGVATTVTGFAADTTLDSQRRRLPGRGR